MICVYCGKENPETNDHVPPKALFARPYPDNLTTAPCCKECNNGASKDDEYFRNKLAMRKDTYLHPDIQKDVLPKTMRALANPKQRKNLDSLLTSIKQTNEGSFYDVDRDRMNKVVIRVVKGLYWHERGEVFPLDGSVNAYQFEREQILNGLDFDEAGKDLFRQILSSPNESKVVGQDVLKYVMHKGSDKHAEFWILVFYKKVLFIAFLIPNLPE